jgi:hypothetical protein
MKKTKNKLMTTIWISKATKKELQDLSVKANIKTYESLILALKDFYMSKMNVVKRKAVKK